MLPRLNATAARRTDTYIEHADTVNVQKIPKKTQDWAGSEVSRSSGEGGGGRAEPSFLTGEEVVGRGELLRRKSNRAPELCLFSYRE